jgi:hypothetical protein
MKKGEFDHGLLVPLEHFSCLLSTDPLGVSASRDPVRQPGNPADLMWLHPSELHKVGERSSEHPALPGARPNGERQNHDQQRKHDHEVRHQESLTAQE